MPIDFSQVKKITIPEGDVKKITIAGVVVWEEVAPKVLTSITLSGQTTSLNRGASFSFGGTVTAHYSDSSTANVTSSTTFSGYNMSTAGTYTVTASYTEDGITKTATYSLTVNKVWSTIWSGSKTVKCANKTISGTATNFTHTANSTGYTPKIRVTFSMSGSGGSYSFNYVYGTGYTSGTASSPKTIDLTNTATITVLGMERTSSNSSSDSYCVYARLQAKKDTTNNRFNFNLTANYLNNTSYTAQLTVTKIEQYY